VEQKVPIQYQYQYQYQYKDSRQYTNE